MEENQGSQQIKLGQNTELAIVTPNVHMTLNGLAARLIVTIGNQVQLIKTQELVILVLVVLKWIFGRQIQFLHNSQLTLVKRTDNIDVKDKSAAIMIKATDKKVFVIKMD